MSLATRCPTCGTVFRVVHDQLLVSEGWVRCGRCAGVFNAADDLLDITTGLPVQLKPPPGAVKPPRRASPDPAAATPDLADRWEAAPAAPVPEPVPEPVPAPSPEVAHPDEASAGLLLRAASQEPIDTGPAAASLDAIPPDAPEGPATRLSAALADPGQAAAPALAAMAAFPQEAPAPAEPAPGFVRAADRAALWRRTPMRAGAAAAALGLFALALAQAALLWRDPLAAQHPGWAGPLQALCRVAGCQVQPLHRIEQLSVDASGLSRVEPPAMADEAASAAAAASPSPQYRLNLTLRNRAETALAAPAVELSLTDSNGQLVLRKVLRLAELGAPGPVLAAGQELSLQALLTVGEHRIDGYTVELFYP